MDFNDAGDGKGLKMATRKQNFVLFISPGTFVSETTQKPIETWDVETAVRMAKEVSERHGAKPFGFQFLTMLVADPVSDGQGGTLDVQPKEVHRSGTYFLTGTVLTRDDISARNDDGNRILLSNMSDPERSVVVENCNSYRSMLPFRNDDYVVDESGKLIARGDDPKYVAFRQESKRKQDEELAIYRKKA